MTFPKVKLKNTALINLSLFASGNGSNVERIHDWIKSRKLDDPKRKDSIRIKMVFVNNKDAYVIKRCQRLHIPYFIFEKNKLYDGSILEKLHYESIDIIALCGFLLLIPPDIIKQYENRIVNIHPSLLPKYGGKNMYGMNVHRSVIDNKERYSGITIHYVNEKYDSGDVIFKMRTPVSVNETPESLANKIHILEHRYYPVIIYGVSTSLLK